MTRSKDMLAALILAATVGLAGHAQAKELVNQGKLLLTGGVSTVEGSGGGGISSWATITGYDTPEGVGGNVHATYIKLPDYTFRAYGAAVGIYDRVELSWTRQEFDTGKTGGKLGLGDGFTSDQDVFGAKVRVLGDAVYDQDKWYPQISVGAQYKSADQAAIIHAVGGKDAHGTDFYVAGTKVLLDQSLVLNGTVRFTKANQIGLLGFGGDKHNSYQPQFEGSLGYLVSKNLVVGAEYRTKPDNLGFAKEKDWYDLFGAYALNKHLSLTAAYVDLGDIATFKSQRGVYLSLQAGF
jgi:hypothetical protein